jgi:arginine deiminase
MLGVGLRTNLEAAEQLMLKDLFGTTCVAVVHDHFEQDQDRMHLDCMFNILGRDCVVCIVACFSPRAHYHAVGGNALTRATETPHRSPPNRKRCGANRAPSLPSPAALARAAVRH